MQLNVYVRTRTLCLHGTYLLEPRRGPRRTKTLGTPRCCVEARLGREWWDGSAKTWWNGQGDGAADWGCSLWCARPTGVAALGYTPHERTISRVESIAQLAVGRTDGRSDARRTATKRSPRPLLMVPAAAGAGRPRNRQQFVVCPRVILLPVGYYSTDVY